MQALFQAVRATGCGLDGAEAMYVILGLQQCDPSAPSSHASVTEREKANWNTLSSLEIFPIFSRTVTS